MTGSLHVTIRKSTERRPTQQPRLKLYTTTVVIVTIYLGKHETFLMILCMF